VKLRLVPALTHLLALVAGGAIGFGIGNRVAVASLAALTDFGTAMYSSLRASGERLHGTDATYENALQGYVLLLDNLSARDRSEPLRQLYAADKALSLIRLADLAEKRGASAEATRLTSDALAACATGALPYCSSAELRERAQSVDALFKRAGQAK
jgi:hypothetical protein